MSRIKQKRYYIDYSLSNGLGHPSISIFLTGCDKKNRCKNCHNSELWNISPQQYDDYSLDDIFQQLTNEVREYKKYHSKLYISILGGEPLALYNRDITLKISKYIKETFKNATIVLYTWRTKEDINNQNLIEYLKYIDYGVLGEFRDDLMVKNTLPSSTNQQIYDFNKKVIIKPIKLK